MVPPIIRVAVLGPKLAECSKHTCALDKPTRRIPCLSSRYWRFIAILPLKKRQAPLNNRVAMATIKVTDKQNFHFPTSNCST